MPGVLGSSAAGNEPSREKPNDLERRSDLPDPTDSEDLSTLAVLIPAWEPGPALLALVSDLLHLGFQHILVVDDGSGPATHALFTRLTALPHVQLLRHAVNRGKGRALKTGFAYLLHTQPALRGTITADADGQHLPVDIARVACALLHAPDAVVLGCRGFAGQVPWRSRAGNALTRRIFRWLTGTALPDTQTGLRAFPQSLVPALLSLTGNRYEYETAVLAHLCAQRWPLRQVGIATVYQDGNRDSHFHPLWDSVRIYGTLVRLAGRYDPG